MFDSPTEYCGRCGEYIALDVTQQECAARHGCGLGPCPLEACFQGTQAELRAMGPSSCAEQAPALSPAAAAFLEALAGCGQAAFSRRDAERILHTAAAGIETVVTELRDRGLVQLAFVTGDECGYGLTQDGKRYVAREAQRRTP